MKATLIIFYLFSLLKVTGQWTDTANTYKPTAAVQSGRPEILSGGFIDVIQTGQMNASARLFKLYIGEPGKFRLPVCLYTGVSSNTTGITRSNEDLGHHLINPSAGIFNLSFDEANALAASKAKLTSFQITYSVAIRVLPAFNPLRFTNVAVFNTTETLGLILTTGAWERDKSLSTGTFWVNARLIISFSPSEQVNQLLATRVKGVFPGYSFGMGIEVYKAVNVKFLYYQYIRGGNPPPFKQPFFQAGFNYSLR